MASRVKFSLGYTRNMKEFESLRIDVGVESDQLDGESTAEAMERVKTFVSNQLFEELDQIESQLRVVRGK